MKRCTQCGALTESDGTTCPDCGGRLDEATESLPVVSELTEESGEYGDLEGPVLIVRKGPEVGERFYLERPEVTIGRDPSSDIFLNDVTVSRKHAVITVEGGATAHVRDVGSLNGTYVNGVCVDEADLEDGDSLQIGTFQMLFLAGGGR